MQRADADDDMTLLHRVRRGDDEAFTTLYRRVAPNARSAARHIVRDADVADDLVHDAFYQTLRAVRSGHGPTDSFGAYILATVKRLAYRHALVQRRMTCTDDNTLWERLIAPPAFHSPQTDLVAAAWASLPSRWRSVLWLIEVDRYSPAELAPGMKMTANAVSSLATRARGALRSAYLAQLQEA
ncbi:RNA polymerase sigma factor [Phytoactinopolyspora limicola]|uniref:RNA polymerase sigma factor n=1 Tax=Phytoactinopolyspora limicola TaxID=2715536 RepID=UPI001FE7C27D|nr:sigma-70 family RNA polymerase sigma factor [Phytoactinopolyspora limicola]